jgi:hypothetical protein
MKNHKRRKDLSANSSPEDDFYYRLQQLQQQQALPEGHLQQPVSAVRLGGVETTRLNKHLLL